MTTNKERFLKLVTGTDTESIEKARFRNANRLWLRESKRVAIKVLVALKEQNLSQKDLAERMQVSPQYVSKLVKGGENLTLDTITKLQNIFGLELLASPKKKESVVVSPLGEYTSVYEKEYATFNNNTDHYKITG